MPNRYEKLIEKVFLAHYRDGAEEVRFERTDIEEAATTLRMKLPKNLGDVIYSFRFRTDFPESVTSRAPAGKSWVIRLVGRARYCFVASKLTVVTPRNDMACTKVPDATPGMILKYAFDDEQALLAKLRYNRLVDVFTGITCYSLQSHLRTAVAGIGQVEIDELYIGLDRRGAHYVFPVQAKGGCREKFPTLICRPIAAQFMKDQTIAMFEFEREGPEIAVSVEKHYRLVPEDQVSQEDLAAYRDRTAGV